MQKLQDSVFSIVKTTNLSPAVFSYLQPSEDFTDKTPLGGILSDTKHGWLALGPKFCVVDLRTGLKVAARTFGAALSNFRTTVTSVVELPTPLTDNSQQLIISLECEDIAGMICIFHINGSQILRCIQTDIVVTELAVCDELPDGPFRCFDGVLMAGTKTGEIFVFDLNRHSLLQALKDISQGYEHVIRSEENAANIAFLSLNAVSQIATQRQLALENDDHIAVLLNESSIIDGQYIFRNPDGTVRMKAKRDHIRVTVLQYIPQLGSMAVGFNFGAFQIWNLTNLDLEFTSQVNVECLPVTHFGFQEPCDDPRAFCYLWVVFSVIDRFEEEEFPLAVMYSLTYQGKRMLSDTKCLYQEFLTATIRFQVELSTTEEDALLVGGRCVSCHSYSVNSMLGGEGEESMLNICQLVWECWGENANSSCQYGMLLFDLDQWYKDQMPATYQLQSNAFMSATCCTELARGGCVTLDVRLSPASVSVYCAATRLEEHFYPNSLRYNCICLNTSEACVLSTIGIQRQIINSMDEIGPTAMLNPTRLYNACVATGLVPLYVDTLKTISQDEQRRYLLSVALEARLSRFLKRCAHDWATGSHAGAGCTLTFLVDWCWKRAIELKENARELTSPLFTSSSLPDRNVVRCLEHCVQQLTQLTGLLDAVLTKCCNLVVPDALSEMEEKYKGIGTVSLYFQVVQWFLRCGLLPERNDSNASLPFPGPTIADTYSNRRLKLQRLQDQRQSDDNSTNKSTNKSCSLLYIDQLIEQEFGGDRVHQMWLRGGSECQGLYPPPSLYSLLRLYLLPDIAEEHKHSLVLYLLVDYSMVYDEIRYEAVIRRLMQFPTMFGLSNTAIKATQAFWHLDHRDFDFALDQLQCLTGNTLSEWQHNVVLSSLLVQKKTQAALQYLHVRKPPPVQDRDDNPRVNDYDKLEDWQSCCNLYLARGLVFEALDVIRTCVLSAGSPDDKTQVLNFFFKGCRSTGQLSKLLQVTLMPFEEEVFTRFLQNCNESQTSDLLIMYYLQQARYLEAEQYNSKLKHFKPRTKDNSTSMESLADVMNRDGARDTLVEVVCSSLPSIANSVAHCAIDRDIAPRVVAPKPMSVFIQAKSPKNTFTYKSSFIQDTIENASETWINKPRMRKGIKRALNIEETPFICTPKLNRSRSVLEAESTPAKRARLNLSGTPRTPRGAPSAALSAQLATLLDMPESSPDARPPRAGPETPHSILKIRSNEGMLNKDAPSPSDSKYMGESDEEMLETASNHTHYSDSTNKHLRFTIPTASESGSPPSTPALAPMPAPAHYRDLATETEQPPAQSEKEMDVSVESYVTTTTETHAMNEPHPLESPPKKQATEDNIRARKAYKDSVRSRRSLSANSSLSDDPNTSIESIADIPITLINPRYTGERRRSTPELDRVTETEDMGGIGKEKDERPLTLEVPKTPTSRRGIRASGESTPLMNRSRSVTPERQDSPITPLRPIRMTRSRSRTPEISPRSSPLESIPEQPRQEVESEPHPVKTTLSVTRQLRSRSRTPERIEKFVESPRLEAITESPTKASDSPPESPTRRNLRSPSLPLDVDMPEELPASPRILRSRSRTPEVEGIVERSASPRTLRSRSRTPEVEIPIERPASPRTFRSRSKTPEKLMSPKKEIAKSAKKSLSRIVLEANAVKSIQNLEKMETDLTVEDSESTIECTPMKSLKSVPSLMDVTFSPIVSKSILQSSNDSVLSESVIKENKNTDESAAASKSIPAFTMDETRFGKSVLNSFESTIGEISSIQEDIKETKTEKGVSKVDLKSLPADAQCTTLSESYLEKSVLHSYQSSVGETSSTQETVEKTIETDKPTSASISFNVTDTHKSVLGSYESSVEVSSVEVNETKDLEVLRESKSGLKYKSSHRKRDKEEQIKKAREIEAEIQRHREKLLEMERKNNQSDISEDQDSVEGENEESEESEDRGIESESDEGEEAKEDEEVEDEEVEDEEVEDEEVEDEEVEDEEVEGEEVEGEEVEGEEVEGDEVEGEEVEGEEVEGEEIEGEELEGEEVEDEDVEDEEVEGEEADASVSCSEDEAIASREDEVICISESSSSSTDKLQISEQPAIANQQMPIVPEMPEDKATEMTTEVNVDNTDRPKNVHKLITEESEEGTIEPLNQSQVSLMTEDNSSRQDESDVAFNSEKKVKDNTKDESIVINKEEVPMETEQFEPALKIQITVDMAPTNDDKGKQEEAADTEAMDCQTIESIPDSKGTDVIDSNPPAIEILITEKKIISAENDAPVDLRIKDSKREPIIQNILGEGTKSSGIAKEDIEPKDVFKEQDRPGSRIKRGQSTSSNKSTREIDSDADIDIGIEEPITPITRNRSLSIASNKSVTETEETAPETDKNVEITTPSSRRRLKTPTSPEVRKILTRRASKELSEKWDDSQAIVDVSQLDESVLSTPKRRSTRSRSKNFDDNVSIASGSSVRSTRNKPSEDARDIKPGQVRKGRKSILTSKPDLSVIPELAIEEGTKVEEAEDLIKEYSSSRRLTRNQKALLESWLEPRSPRRASTASRASAQSDQSVGESTPLAFNVQAIDRISLLNKTSFEGSPDPSEMQDSESPESIASDASKQHRLHATRAASETKTTPKAAKIGRRVSMDIVATAESGSPVRGRRASFNRACEALLTPKGRRTSTDLKRSDSGSRAGSPAPFEEAGTPRRGRRPSAQSDTSKRSKKWSALEEIKDTKK